MSCFLFVGGTAFVSHVWASERGIICLLHAALWSQNGRRLRQRWRESGSRWCVQVKDQARVKKGNQTKTMCRLNGRCLPVSWPLNLHNMPGGWNLGYHVGKTACEPLNVWMYRNVKNQTSRRRIANFSHWESLFLSVCPLSPPQPYLPDLITLLSPPCV